MPRRYEMFHRPRFFSWIYLGVAILFFCFALPSVAQSATPRPVTSMVGPIVRPAVHHDVSPALRDLPAISQSQMDARDNEEDEPVRRIPWPHASNAPLQAAVVQSTAAAPSPEVAITVNQNFEGLGDGQNNFTVRGAPPDTNGAVGQTQYVQWVNTSFAVFDKATGALAAGFPKAGNTLWSGFGGGCQTNNDGDPIAQYDKAAGRWILTQFAVSTTSDATGSYNRYAFSYGATQFNDYPKLGVWPDGYYATYNIFNNGQTF